MHSILVQNAHTQPNTHARMRAHNTHRHTRAHTHTLMCVTTDTRMHITHLGWVIEQCVPAGRKVVLHLMRLLLAGLAQVIPAHGAGL